MRANSLNRDMFKPFRSHNGLLRWVFGCVFEALHRFWRGFLQRDASMRALWSDRPNCSHNVSQKVKLGTGKRGHYERGLFTGGISRISLNSLESLENGWILLCFPQSGGSLESLKSLNSLESLENGLFWKDPFSKRPLFPNPINVSGAFLTKARKFRGK